MMKEKIRNLNERDKIEDIILYLEASNTSKEVQDKISDLKVCIDDLLNQIPDDSHKLYLSNIVRNENVKFNNNNLILAPVGSGKTTLIGDIVEKVKGKVLMLVSNRFLKDSTCPSDRSLKFAQDDEGISQMMFTTNDEEVYGTKDYTVHVMTYAEFGCRIQRNNNFLEEGNFAQIHCDEIHSLVEYKKISNSEPLIHAIKYLFDKHEGTDKFYYTATRESLDSLEEEIPGTLEHVGVYNFLNHPDIKKYVALAEYKINHIEQIRPHLEARLESFDYFGHKGMAFNRSIKGLKRIEEILTEEGYKPLVLWSDNNPLYPLSRLQIEAREELIMTNKIPEPYNFLVINSAMREGWDLKDPKLKLAIMNTTNATDKIQALGRIRKDIDILIYRTNTPVSIEKDLMVPEHYIDKPLTTEIKKELCDELNVINKSGNISQWVTIKPLLEKDNYKITDSRKTIDGKRVRVSIISKN